MIVRHADRIAELWRFYKIGVINTVFGLGLYSVLVFVGFNLFVAQILSHICGASFNYFTLTRHVFTGHKPNLPRYVASYGANYLIGLGCLALFHHFIRSPYIAGFLTAASTSMINYIILKLFVFRRRERRDAT